MKFQVPQFIEVEDKIFGPLTLSQFIYLVGGAGIAYTFYRFLPGFISLILVPIPILFALLLAFYKVNDRPFIDIVEAGIKYLSGHKLYLWKKQEKQAEAAEVVKRGANGNLDGLFVPRLSESKLKDLSWSLDVNEKIHGTIYSKETQALGTRKSIQEGK